MVPYDGAADDDPDVSLFLHLNGEGDCLLDEGCVVDGDTDADY
jgi:hypothetical protein